jgi:hypothetical protein
MKGSSPLILMRAYGRNPSLFQFKSLMQALGRNQSLFEPGLGGVVSGESATGDELRLGGRRGPPYEKDQGQ